MYFFTENRKLKKKKQENTIESSESNDIYNSDSPNLNLNKNSGCQMKHNKQIENDIN